MAACNSRWHLASVRFYIRGKDDETMVFPTQKGVSVNVADLPKLLQAVEALCQAAGVNEVSMVVVRVIPPSGLAVSMVR